MIRIFGGWAILALTVACIMGASSAHGQPAAGVVVPKELEGTYLALSISKGGKDATEEFRISFKMQIAKDDMTFTIKDKRYPAKITRIDPKAKPAIIDIAPSEGPEKGKTFLGIYSLSGGELTLAFTEKGDRPRDFSGEDDAAVLRLRKLEKKAKKN